MQSDFYNKLKEYKKKNKVSNADLGQIIGKNEPAMRMAINRESLSVFEIQEIEKLFTKSNKQEGNLESRVELLESKVENQKETIDSLKERIKMIYDQLLFFQNSWIAAEKNKDKKSG